MGTVVWGGGGAEPLTCGADTVPGQMVTTEMNSGYRVVSEEPRPHHAGTGSGNLKKTIAYTFVKYNNTVVNYNKTE